MTDAKDIVGTWQESDTDYQFNEDGAYRSGRWPELLAELPRTIGEFWFGGGQFFKKEIKVSDMSSCGSIIGTYEAKMLENGNLVFTVVEDECWVTCR